MEFAKQIETLFGTGTAGGLTDGQLLERFLEHRGEAHLPAPNSGCTRSWEACPMSALIPIHIFNDAKGRADHGRVATSVTRVELSRSQESDFSFFMTNINCFSLVLNSVGISPVGSA